MKCYTGMEMDNTIPINVDEFYKVECKSISQKKTYRQN